MTKRMLRSLLWEDPKDQAATTENYRAVNHDRLTNLTAIETKLLDHLLDFYQRNAEAPQLAKVLTFFEGQSEADVVVLIEEVAALQPIFGASFKDLFEEEVEDQAADLLVSTCKTAIKMAKQGVEIGKQKVKGTDEAVAYLFSSLREKPKGGEGRMPASMKASSAEMKKLYDERKANPHQTYGIQTGYGLFDQATAGIRKKQLRLHVGFGGHLKSTCMLNEIVNAAVNGGYNGLLFSSEMPAEDIKFLMAAIHSANERFNGIGRPLSASRLILGALRPDEEVFYQTVWDDLVNNPDHGSIRVVDSSEFTSWGTVVQRTIREHSEEEVDLLWCDYITRLPLDPKYRGWDVTTARNETIADAKRFAMSFDGGKGLAVCSPFQMNREGYKKAKANEGRVDKTALAQYNAAEKEADIITYVFYDAEEQATSEPKIGVLKSRWGRENHDPSLVFIEPDSRRIFDLQGGLATTSTSYAPTAGTAAADDVVL